MLKILNARSRTLLPLGQQTLRWNLCMYVLRRILSIPGTQSSMIVWWARQKKISYWRRGLPTCPSIYYRVECDCSFIVCLLRIWSTTPVYTEYSISMYRSIYFVYDCLCSTSPAVKPHVPAKSTLTMVRVTGENEKGCNNTAHYNNTTRGLQTCCGVFMTRDHQNDRQSTEPSMGLIPGNYTAGIRWNGWIVCGKVEKKWFCGF